MKGEAEAYAVEAKAKAEAEQMEKKASAWKEYQDAAVVDMILDVLPKVVHHSIKLKCLQGLFVVKFALYT